MDGAVRAGRRPRPAGAPAAALLLAVALGRLRLLALLDQPLPLLAGVAVAHVVGGPLDQLRERLFRERRVPHLRGEREAVAPEQLRSGLGRPPAGLDDRAEPAQGLLLADAGELALQVAELAVDELLIGVRCLVL